MMAIKFVGNLIQKIQFSFSYTHYSRYSDVIFKDYYSRRLNIDKRELENILVKVCKYPIQDSDHRWISLIQNIEDRLSEYSIQSKIYIAKSLIEASMKNELFKSTMTLLINEISQMQISQVIMLFWCLSKNDKKVKPEQVALIYRRLLEILKKGGSAQDVKIVVTVQIPDKGIRQNQKITFIKASALAMCLNCIGDVQVQDKFLTKLLIKKGLRENIQQFDLQSLCFVLAAFQKLGMRNKRDSILVYDKIRHKAKDLTNFDTPILINLAINIANLSLREPSLYEKEDKEEMKKFNAIINDMKIFYLWLVETLMIREQLSIESSSKLLMYGSKAKTFQLEIWQKLLAPLLTEIQKCKIIDLMMAIRAICQLSVENRRKLNKEQQILLKRLWLFHNSIAGRSMDILLYLYQNKKIKVPILIKRDLESQLRIKQNRSKINSVEN